MKGIRKRQEIVAKLARKHGAALVQFQPVFDEAAKRAPADYWIWDGMQPVSLSKDRAAEWLDCLREGRPIEGVESVSHAVTLAGICFHLATTGAVRGPRQGLSLKQSMMFREQCAASVDANAETVKNSIMMLGFLVSRIDVGDYDESFEPDVEIEGVFDPDAGVWRVNLDSGHKSYKGESG